jgi:hypothetical protein
VERLSSGRPGALVSCSVLVCSRINNSVPYLIDDAVLRRVAKSVCVIC